MTFFCRDSEINIAMSVEDLLGLADYLTKAGAVLQASVSTAQ